MVKEFAVLTFLNALHVPLSKLRELSAVEPCDYAALRLFDRENRVAFAVDAAAPALRGVLALRAVEVGQALSSLRARSMGYDAVPFPDEARFHNEGVFGDELALPVVREFVEPWRGRPGQPLEVEAVRDHLAREVLGFDRPGPD